MTIYALNLQQVHDTIRRTLVEKVAPAVGSSAARDELAGVIEMIDNLNPRLGWETGQLSEAVSRTTELAKTLGVAAADGEDVDALRATRESVGAALEQAYTKGIDGGIEPAVVAAVAEFSKADIEAQISRALRPGLPD